MGKEMLDFRVLMADSQTRSYGHKFCELSCWAGGCPMMDRASERCFAARRLGALGIGRAKGLVLGGH